MGTWMCLYFSRTASMCSWCFCWRKPRCRRGKPGMRTARTQHVTRQGGRGQQDTLPVGPAALQLAQAHPKALGHLLLRVLRSLDQPVYYVLRRRLELHVVRPVRLRVDPPPHHALRQHVVRHLQLDENLRLDSSEGERRRLRSIEGEPVQEPPLCLCVLLIEAVADDGHHSLQTGVGEGQKKGQESDTGA